MPLESRSDSGDPGHYLAWSDRGRAGIGWYASGSVLVLSISLFIGQVFGAVGDALISSDSAAATVIKTMFFGFIVSFLTVPLVPLFLNRRPWWSIAMPRVGFGAANLLLGAAIVVGVEAVKNLINWIASPDAYEYGGVDVSVWVPMLAVTAIAYFVQAATEEMVYRGYLTQFARRLVKAPAFYLLVPSLVFAYPHYGNIEGLVGPISLLPYVIVGLAYAWLAFRSGSVWMAVGAHLGNNWFITSFVVSRQEKLATISLFTTKETSSTAWGYVIDALILAVLVAGIAEVVLRRTGRIVPIASPARADQAST